jgi:hypothetical protein
VRPDSHHHHACESKCGGETHEAPWISWTRITPYRRININQHQLPHSNWLALLCRFIRANMVLQIGDRETLLQRRSFGTVLTEIGFELGRCRTGCCCAVIDNARTQHHCAQPLIQHGKRVATIHRQGIHTAPSRRALPFFCIPRLVSPSSVFWVVLNRSITSPSARFRDAPFSALAKIFLPKPMG